MAAYILDTTARQAPPIRVEEDDRLSAAGSAAAAGIAAAAILMALAPAVVAVVAIASPGELDRLYGWVLGGSVASVLVAAGRVPAAALFGLILAQGQAEQ